MQEPQQGPVQVLGLVLGLVQEQVLAPPQELVSEPVQALVQVPVPVQAGEPQAP
ncbi:MAG: hypothetical protein HGA97_00625 [Chlorobiaceae bacterium]|nr:hypothetical protein [Chlorobiaceae bacterium]